VEIALFLFALIIRLWNFSDIEFKLDEALAVFKASQYWFTGKLPLYGLISSTGAANPPLFLYLLSIPALISPNPLFLTFFFAVTGSLSVLVIFKVLKNLLSEKFAFFSALLFATSAWPVIFSRKIWAQNLMPLLSSLVFYYFFEILSDEKKSTTPLIVLALWAFQIHLSGFLIFFPVLVFLTFFNFKKRKILLKEVFLGILFGTIPLVPYFLFLIKDEFRNFLLLFGSRSGALPFYDFHNFTSPFRMSAGFYFARSLGADYFEFIQTLPYSKIIFGFFNLESFLAVLGFFLCFLLQGKFLILAFGFIIMATISFLSKRPAIPFYQEPYFPLIFAFLGVSFWQIFQLKFFGKILFSLIFLLSLGSNIVFISHFYNFVHRKQQINGDYGLVYWQKEKLVQEAVKNFKYHLKESQIVTRARVYFSIFNYDKDKKVYLPQKELLPVVNFELGQ